MEGRNYGIWHVGDSDYMLTTGPDYISHELKKGVIWEADVLRYAARLLHGKSDPVIIDIGANLGAFTVPLAKMLTGRGAKFFAFEPQRAIYYQLCGNLFLNDIFHCQAMNKAIGDYDGLIDMPVLNPHESPNNGGLSLDATFRKEQGWPELEQFVPVEIAQLDSLGLPHADLIKIDVEGWELEAITGGREYLRACGYPPIIFELWGDEIPSAIEKGKRLLALFEELGYAVSGGGETYIAQHKNYPWVYLS